MLSNYEEPMGLRQGDPGSSCTGFFLCKGRWDRQLTLRDLFRRTRMSFIGPAFETVLEAPHSRYPSPCYPRSYPTFQTSCCKS